MLLTEICEWAVSPNVLAELAEPDGEPPALGKTSTPDAGVNQGNPNTGVVG